MRSPESPTGLGTFTGSGGPAPSSHQDLGRVRVATGFERLPDCSPCGAAGRVHLPSCLAGARRTMMTDEELREVFEQTMAELTPKLHDLRSRGSHTSANSSTKREAPTLSIPGSGAVQSCRGAYGRRDKDAAAGRRAHTSHVRVTNERAQLIPSGRYGALSCFCERQSLHKFSKERGVRTPRGRRFCSSIGGRT